MCSRSRAASVGVALLSLSVESVVAMVEIPQEHPVWILSSAGASCDAACKARGGCREDAWPATEQEFKELLQVSGLSCVGIQQGGAKYDPSSDGRYCGWEGSASDEEPRCATRGDGGTMRFCPCHDDKEL
eukprot:TRINITY_DN91501_c0_g1_i1.p2 TRINITY_DN91501_c0_g1~~TRINITY_DN91501_c0_g1_i1.p2  ORF type:complete len:140 (+),score=15.03 TRINITY_DN91501_c0_g1_i1:31-420(+)